MKKIVLVALAVSLTAIGGSYALNVLKDIEEHSKCEAGYKCSFCKGTGWSGERKCIHCSGTGANSSY